MSSASAIVQGSPQFMPRAVSRNLLSSDRSAKRGVQGSPESFADAAAAGGLTLIIEGRSGLDAAGICGLPLPYAGCSGGSGVLLSAGKSLCPL
jgi:hypothetical protein